LSLLFAKIAARAKIPRSLPSPLLIRALFLAASEPLDSIPFRLMPAVLMLVIFPVRRFSASRLPTPSGKHAPLASARLAFRPSIRPIS
jgi:hypothetical protein